MASSVAKLRLQRGKGEASARCQQRCPGASAGGHWARGPRISAPRLHLSIPERQGSGARDPQPGPSPGDPVGISPTTAALTTPVPKVSPHPHHPRSSTPRSLSPRRSPNVRSTSPGPSGGPRANWATRPKPQPRQGPGSASRLPVGNPRFQEGPAKLLPAHRGSSHTRHRLRGGTSSASLPAGGPPGCRAAGGEPSLSFWMSFPSGSCVPGIGGSAGLVHRFFPACFPNCRCVIQPREVPFCLSNSGANFRSLLFSRHLPSAPSVPATHHSSRLFCSLGEITRLFLGFIWFFRFSCPNLPLSYPKQVT